MKIAIVYASKYGATKEAAEYLASKFTQVSEVFNIADNPSLSLEGFDAVVLGSSIYVGAARKQIVAFSEKEKERLLKIPLGIFVVCGAPEKNGLEYLANSFPKELVEHATRKGAFGGEFQFDKMNFFERFIIKQMNKSQEKKNGKTVPPTLHKERIASFAKEFEHELLK